MSVVGFHRPHPHPDGCDCEQCCGPGFNPDGLMDCWKQMAQFKQFMMDTLSQLGPFPLKGVTDGSSAQPGEVGEFIQLIAQQAYPVAGGTYQIVALGVIPPGDWDIWAFARPSAPMDWLSLVLSPVPDGISDPMFALQSTQQTAQELMVLVTPQARGLFSVPTLMAFNMGSDATTSNTPGTATVNLCARRMR